MHPYSTARTLAHIRPLSSLFTHPCPKYLTSNSSLASLHPSPARHRLLPSPFRFEVAMHPCR